MPSPGILVLVLVVAGCTASTATPSPGVRDGHAARRGVARSPSATPAASTSIAPAPSPSPAASPLAADFTTPAPGSSQPWTSIAWTPIAADDPLGTVAGMVAAPAGGYVAWANPVATSSTTSASPMWASTDGTAWHALPADTLGPASVIVGLGAAGGNLIALTLHGGANPCSDDIGSTCWTLATPLQAWTSQDGADWTPSTAPDLTLPVDCTACGAQPPIVAFGGPGALAMSEGDAGPRLALSADGTSWTDLPATALPATFQIGAISGQGNGFVAVGDDGAHPQDVDVVGPGPGPAHAEVATSSDGMTWTVHHLTGQGDPAAGSTGRRELVAADGVLIAGSTYETPGRTLWWTSPDAVTWHFDGGYSPLGVWNGEGAGTGLVPDGAIAADGTRLLALRDAGNVRSWISADGATWTSVPSTGMTAQPKGDGPDMDLVMLPVGVVAVEAQGARWFGTPAQ